MSVSKKASITDVARRAKVSITTVSRVINKVPTVNKEIAAQVEEAIAVLRFKPNATAQRLARGGLNNAIGFVIPGFPGVFHSFYAVELMRGIGHGCEVIHLDLIFHITDGHNPLKSSYAGGLIFADIIENRSQDGVLTPREVDVLDAVYRGQRNKQIAVSLGIGVETVRAHLKSIFMKLDVTDRTAAVNVALHRGIIHLR